MAVVFISCCCDDLIIFLIKLPYAFTVSTNTNELSFYLRKPSKMEKFNGLKELIEVRVQVVKLIFHVRF